MRRVVNKMANICKQAEVHSQTQLLISVFLFYWVFWGDWLRNRHNRFTGDGPKKKGREKNDIATCSKLYKKHLLCI
jgi:hypothetical protein